MNNNKMGDKPIPSLLLSMSGPLIVAMLIQALYNVVDSMYVSQVSQNALTAVSLCYPMQMLIIAFSVGLGVGMNAWISKSLGARDQEKASLIAGNGLVLSILCSLGFLVYGQLGAHSFFTSQTDVAEIVEGGTAYLTICCSLSITIFIQICYERLLQSTGRTGLTLISQASGAIVNILLDPVMIFGYFGLPAMGVAGAAIATVIGQATACVLAIILNQKYNHEIKLEKSVFRLRKSITVPLLIVAVPSIVMQAITSILGYLMNLILLGFSTTAATVYGIFIKLQSLFFMPMFGIMNAMVPILAFNFGARQPKRMEQVFLLATLWSLILGVVGTLVMLFIPDQLLMAFEAEQGLLDIGRVALQLLGISFPLSAISIGCCSALQVVGKSTRSMVISIFRQLIVILPLAYYFSLQGNLEMVWLSFPIAEGACLVMAVWMLLGTRKRLVI